VSSKTSPRGIEALVDEQVRRWTLAQRERKKEEVWPVVTVSREFGSLGAAIARRVADRMGFAFWDQEVVHEIAEQTGASEKLVSSLDEHARGILDDLIASTLYGAKGTTDEYARQLARVLHALGAHGAAVIVGRGAQYVLSSDAALRVRVVCALDKRVAGYAQREGLEPKVAEKKVREVEQDRRTFIQQRFGKDVTDPTSYDLLVNAGTLPLDGGAELIVSAYRAKFRRVPPAPKA